MYTIAIHTSKGGVGKTTLTVNISYELALKGYKVLVVDLDDQANSSLYLGVNKADKLDKAKSIEEFNQILQSFQQRKEVIDLLQADLASPELNCSEYIRQDSPFNKYIEKMGSKGRIDVLPGSYKTKDNESLGQVAGGGGIRETRLHKILQKTQINSIYDYVIIDTPPSLTTVASNGLYAARYLIIPTQMEYFSVFGVTAVMTNIKKTVFVDTDGQRGRVLGVVPMMTDKSNSKINKFASQLLEQMLLPDILFSPVKRAISFANAAKDRLPVSVLAEKNAGARAAAMQLTKVTDELIERIEKDQKI